MKPWLVVAFAQYEEFHTLRWQDMGKKCCCIQNNPAPKNRIDYPIDTLLSIGNEIVVLVSSTHFDNNLLNREQASVMRNVGQRELLQLYRFV